MAKRIPLEHEEAIVAAYLAGSSLAQAVAPFGYSNTTCLDILRRRGIEPRNRAEVCRIPPEHEEAIVTTYLAGATQSAAAALFGYSAKACLNALKRRGIKPRSHAETCRTPAEHEEAMIQAYLEGASTCQAAAMFGYSQQTCTNLLKRRGITPRSREEVCRHYAVDEGFFDQIDTEQKAYWLGFLTADGSIVKGSITLCLQSRDSEHVRKFAAALHAEHPISTLTKNGHSATKIRITSVKLVDALQYLGVRQNKSFSVRPCEHIPGEFLTAYWRGIFDGDGSIYRRRYSAIKSYWEIGLVGNEAIVCGFRSFIGQFINSRSRVRPHKKTVFRIRYSGTNLPRAVVRVLYQNATIYLARKFALAQELMCDGGE